MLTPLEVVDSVFPDDDPELGEAYVGRGRYGVHKILRERKGEVPLTLLEHDPMESALIMPYCTGLDAAGLSFALDT